MSTSPLEEYVPAASLPAAAGSTPTATMATPLNVVCALAVAVGALFWFFFSYGYIEDDAFIHLVFARSLSEGLGFTFNGVVSNGDTAPIWPLLLAALHALGCGWILCAKLACAAGFVVAVAGTACLARDLAHGRSLQRWFPAAAVLVTVVNPFFVHWSFSGMEAVSALGLSFWAVRLALLGNPHFLRCLAAAGLLGLAPLFRPELLLFSAILGPGLLLRWWRARSTQAHPHRLLGTSILAATLVLPVAVWAGYALSTFGAVVPNTNLAKQGRTIAELAPHLLLVYAVGFPVTLLLMPYLTVTRLKSWHVPLAVSVLLLWPLVCMAFYLANHTVVQTRYSLLSMPAMSIAVLWLLGTARRPKLFAGVAATMVLSGIAVICWVVVPHVLNKETYSRALSDISSYMRERIAPGDPVAVLAIGQIAFESRHPLVDLGGITDRSVIEYFGNSAATYHWAKAQGARYFISADPPESHSIRVFETSVPFVGWTLHRSLYSTQEMLAVYTIP